MLQAAHQPVVSLWRPPFALGSPERHVHPAGSRVADIVSAAAPHLPDGFSDRGIVCIAGATVPRAMWPRVRIKSGEVVTLHMPLAGGEGGGKEVIGIVAALALTVATAGIASGALAPALGASLGSAFGVSAATGSALLAAGVGLTGSLILGALSPPPALGEGVEERDLGGTRLEAASVEGNTLERNAPVPRVIGTRRVFPPFASEPFVELDGQDEVVHAIYVLAGPHELTDLRLGDAGIEVPANEAKDLEIELREGLADEDPLQLATRQGRTNDANIELSVHKTDPTDGSQLDPNEADPLPVWHGVATREAPDEDWLQFRLDGLVRPDGGDIRIPLRIRMRRRGDAEWRDLPEIHYMNDTDAPHRLQVRLLWGDPFGDTLPEPPSSQGFVTAYKFVPGQDVNPVGDDFEADSYFDAMSSPAGGDVYESGTATTTDVANITLHAERVDVYLDTSDWTPGVYEIEVKRGAALLDSNFTSSSYDYDGDTLDFFGQRDDGSMPLTRDGLLDRLGLVRLVSVWDQAPIAVGGNAVIALQARNRRVERLSALASGYVHDYGGSPPAWDQFQTTSNPAAHFRDVLRGGLNFDPLPDALLDDDALISWHERCETNGYTCDMVAEGGRTADVLRVIASCGFARPTQSEVWGVAQDFDRSADTPVQIFTPRNSSGFSWRRAFARLPSGFRVNFRDVSLDYLRRQMTVRRRGASASETRLEQVTFDGLVSEDDVIRRAEYDLAQAEQRAAFYRLTAPAEAIVCRRGSLVGVQHDVLVRHHGAARILDTVVSEGDVEQIVLDEPVEVKNETELLSVADILQVEDMLDVGARTGIAIRRTDGTVSVHELSDATGETDTVTLTTPVSDDTNAGGPFDEGSISDIGPGALVSVGKLGAEFKRLIVTEITPQPDLLAQLTMVDEAPDLVAGLS